jgi:uncharacterized damage-inducible protein DinB
MMVSDRPPTENGGLSRDECLMATARCRNSTMTTDLELIQSLYEYNSKVRMKYLTAIWKLPTRDRYRDRGASFPSIVDIYLHVLDAYRLWFDEVYSRGPEPQWYPLGVRYAMSQAQRETRAIDRRVLGVVRSLRPADLKRRFTLPKRWGSKAKIELRVLLVHMVEEELQHRGEMNALLWQMGHDPPITGFDD